MPKTKKVAVKATKSRKQKLSPAERSQIAKDRWAKIRKAKAAQEATTRIVNSILETPPTVEQELEPELASLTSEERIKALKAEEAALRQDLEGESATPKIGRDENGVPSIVGLGDGIVLPNGEFVPSQPPSIPVPPTVEPPAPQLAPAKAPKQKRYTGPKEFSVALKAAEGRLAKAINERAEAMGKLAGLNAEIPSLLQIIQALKGSNNLPSAPYDLTNPMAAFQPPAVPFQAHVDPMDAIRAAMAAPPVSRAIGNAVQLPPEVVGTLEGPDDDDPDKFIAGPHAGGGWVGA